MAVYGVDEYGKALYGADRDVDYTVLNLAAVQTDFGRVTVSWDSPPLADWTALVLVRSGYGFPVALTDGVAVASWPGTGTHTSFSDVGLAPGYWYYTLFLAKPFVAWSASATYQGGDRVSYSASVWICVAPQTTGVTPGSNAAVWSTTAESTQYRPAGSVACLCVQDQGYGGLLDSLVPSAYKALPGTSTDTPGANPQLSAFLSVLGFGFSQVATELDDLLAVYDVVTTRQDRLYEIGQLLGLSSEVASSPRYQRLRTLKAAASGQAKGTAGGIVASVYNAAGLTASCASGYNLALTQDQSAFVTPQPMAWSPSEPYKTGDEVIYLGTRYQCTGFVYPVNTSNYTTVATGTPSALGTTVIGSATYVQEAGASPGSVSIPFTTAANGTYNAIIYPAAGPGQGVLTATIDGVALQLAQILVVNPYYGGLGGTVSFVGPSVDLYNATAGAFSTVRTSSVPLSPGAHTLVLSTATKNSSSSGYGLEFTSVTVYGSPPFYPPGNPPTGASGSAAQWSASATRSSAVPFANPLTGGQGTWSNVGATAVSLSTGYLGG